MLYCLNYYKKKHQVLPYFLTTIDIFARAFHRSVYKYQIVVWNGVEGAPPLPPIYSHILLCVVYTYMILFHASPGQQPPLAPLRRYCAINHSCAIVSRLIHYSHGKMEKKIGKFKKNLINNILQFSVSRENIQNYIIIYVSISLRFRHNRTSHHWINHIMVLCIIHPSTSRTVTKSTLNMYGLMDNHLSTCGKMCLQKKNYSFWK